MVSSIEEYKVVEGRSVKLGTSDYKAKMEIHLMKYLMMLIKKYVLSEKCLSLILNIATLCHC